MHRRNRRALPVVLAVLALSAGACGGSDSAESADPKPTPLTTTADGAARANGSAPSLTTVGPSLGSGDTVKDPTQTSLNGVGVADGSSATVTAPPATYIVPDIPASATAEICAATTQITTADSKIGALLGPALAADASDQADQLLLQALTQVRPLVEEAEAGYNRMAAVLPEPLATDAGTVRDATLTFYGAVTASQTMEGLQATVNQARAFTNSAREAAAHLDAATKKTCNQSIYNA